MKDSERLKLLHAPYAAPPVHRGDVIEDLARGEFVKVGGWTNAPISWPRILKTGRAALIVTDELARAVRTESEIAIAHHWGVCVVTVWAWRKKLGVKQMNEGTTRLYAEYQPEKLPEWVAADGREKAATPEHYARMSEARRGKKALPQTRAALAEASRRRKPKAHREAIGKSNQLHWLKKMPPLPRDLVFAIVEYRKMAPSPTRGVHWHPCEEALLGLGPDRVIASVLGRTRASVTTHRAAIEIPAFELNAMVKNIGSSAATASSTLPVSPEELASIFNLEFEEQS